MSWVSGTFNRVRNWVQDAAAGLTMDAIYFDEEDDNFAGGINNCLTKDGQNAPSQDLPMSTRKHTNVGDAVNRNEYLAVGQYQDGWGVYGVIGAGSTADTYVVDLSPAPTAYVEGMRLWFKADVDCNADAVLNVNTIGDRDLVVGGAKVLAGAIKADYIYVIVYTGTQWQVYASGANDFLSLEDTPVDYTGRAGQAMVVNGDEDALVFSGASINVASIMRGPTQTIPDNTYTKLDFNVADLDTPVDTANLTDNRFDIVTDAVVRVSAHCSWIPPTGDIFNNYGMEFRLNGIAVPGTRVNLDTDRGYTIQNEALIKVEDGDYIEVWINQNLGIGRDTSNPYFSINSV